MDYLEENLPHGNYRGIYTIGLWLLISISPGLYWSYQMGEKLIFSHLTPVIWAYSIVAFISGLGLFFKREWARKGAVWLFSMLFIWALAVIYWFLGPSIKPLAFWLTGYVALEQSMIQKILFTLFIAYILWPVIAVFYLTYPGVKIQFRKDTAKKSDKKKAK
jgi:amino acid transporter